MSFMVKPVPSLVAPRCVLERKDSKIMGDAAKERPFSRKMRIELYSHECRTVKVTFIAL